MHHQDRAEQGVEPRTADQVAIVGAPVNLDAPVDPLHRRAALVQTLELFGGARDRRETPQVLLLLDPHRLAIALARIANRRHGTVPALVLGRTAVLQGAP